MTLNLDASSVQVDINGGGEKLNHFFSVRFQLPVVVTAHAPQRMSERNLTDALLLDIIDTGVDKGAGHHWLY